MNKPLDVLSAGRRICERSNWTISNLELQKILYLAHMVYMGRTGHRLVDERFEAWDYGPVSPQLYHQVKVFGADPVRDVFHSAPPIPQGDRLATIEEACDALLSRSAGQLVAETHWRDGAWAKNYRPGIRHMGISDDDILEEASRRTMRHCRMA